MVVCHIKPMAFWLENAPKHATTFISPCLGNVNQFEFEIWEDSSAFTLTGDIVLLEIDFMTNKMCSERSGSPSGLIFGGLMHIPSRKWMLSFRFDALIISVAR